jgi:hypothetical protein
MLIWVVLLLSVAALGGIIAYAGDVVGRKIGRKHLRLFGLRPKTTGLLMAVASGVAVALVTVGTVALLARNTLDNAIRAQEIRADLETARRQLGLVNEEYRAARRDLEAAQVAQQKLQTQVALNRTQLEAKQRELGQAVELYGRLKTQADQLVEQNRASSQKLARQDETLKNQDQTLKRQDQTLKNLETQRRNLSAKITELAQKRTELQTRIGKLTAEKQSFEQRYTTAQTRLQQTESQLEDTTARFQDTTTRLEATQARLARLETQVREFEESRKTLEGDINELIQTKQDLERSNQQLQQQNTALEKELAELDVTLKETRNALTLATAGEFIYRRNELIVQAVIPEGSPEQVRLKLQGVVRQAGLIAESRGAARGRPLTLTPSDDFDAYVAQAIRTAGPDLVMVRATRNLTRGTQVPVVLDIRSNRTLFLASQPIRTVEFALGSAEARNPDNLLERLQALLREVRNDLRTRNVPLENINPPDVIPDEEVVEFIDRLRTLSGNIVIGVAGRSDVQPSGPLRFYFFILR